MPPSTSEVASLVRSRTALGDFLTNAFRVSFPYVAVSEITFEAFPDGLYAGLRVRGVDRPEYNAWAALVATALTDAGVPVSVFVRASSDFDEIDAEVERIAGRVRTFGRP